MFEVKFLTENPRMGLINRFIKTCLFPF